MRAHILAGILGASALGVAGCSSGLGGFGEALDSRPNAGPCPPAGAAYDSARIVELDGQGNRYNNIAFTGEITGVTLFCRYVAGEPLVAEVEIDMAFGKGPAAYADSRDFTYWVAVTRRSGKVLGKERFSVRPDFEGRQVASLSDLVGRVTIPRADEGVSGANFEVLVGFELSDEQLAFNRQGQRFRLDAAR